MPFSTLTDFDKYHQALGEACDYGSMRQELLESVSTSHGTSWFDIDLSWLDLPDVDLSMFDFFDL